MNSLKEAFSKQNLLKNLNFFGELNLGLILTAVGIVYFKNPNHFAFGGTSGLSILLADLFPKINVGGFMWIINLVLVVLGFVFLGIKCMGWTIYSSFALSFFVSVCEWLYPVNGCFHERRCHAGSGVRRVPAGSGRGDRIRHRCIHRRYRHCGPDPGQNIPLWRSARP